MFLGTFSYTIDPKGRLFIPAKLRDAAPSRPAAYILTQGLEGCLYLYDTIDFQKLVMGQLNDVPTKKPQDARAFKRLLLSGAQDVSPDEMGRILIPRPHVDYAALKKDVAILGVGERIELWADERWAKYKKTSSGAFERLSREWAF